MASDSVHPNYSFWADLLTRDDENEEEDTDTESYGLPSPPSRSCSPSLSSSSDTGSDMDTGSGANEATETPSALAIKVKQVLTLMSTLGLTLPGFLHALSWGDADCIKDPQIRGARTVLMNSNELHTILQHWWKPPRSTVSHKSRSHAARCTMEAFASNCLHDVLDQELEDVARLMKTPDDVSEEFYTSTKFAALAADTKTTAPVLWSLLHQSAYTERQVRRNSRKDPTKVCMSSC